MTAAASVGLAHSCTYDAGVRADDWHAEQAARIDQLVAHFLTPHATGQVLPPSISIAIGRDGTLLLAKSYGPTGATDDRKIYRIGSITKQFTAAAVLRLIEQSVATPISRKPLTLDTHMDEVFENVDHWQSADEPPISVRSLLTMTSNLPNFTRRPPPNTDPWGAVPAPRLLEEVKKMAPHGWPNSFEYSNTSYFLLAQLIGRMSGGQGEDPWRDWVRRETIERAGLRDTGFSGEEAFAARLAQPNYHRRPAFAEPDWLVGSGDMVSTATDLFRWNRALISGAVLAEASMSAMFSDGARVAPTSYYGMGWFVEHSDGWDHFSHSGSVPGYTSYNAIRRQANGTAWRSVTLLTNSDGVEGLDELAEEIFGVVESGDGAAAR